MRSAAARAVEASTTLDEVHVHMWMNIYDIHSVNECRNVLHEHEILWPVQQFSKYDKNNPPPKVYGFTLFTTLFLINPKSPSWRWSRAADCNIL